MHEVLVNRLGGLSLRSTTDTTRKSEVQGKIPGLATYLNFSSADSRMAVVKLLAKVCARSTG